MLTVRPNSLENHASHGDAHACLQIRRLVSGMPSDERERRTFVVFQIAIDDSGRGQESDPAFVLAGYAARVQNWEAFSDRWQEVLHKRPRLEYLKAKEAYSLQDQFKGWTPPQRDKRLLELIALIHQFSPSGVKLVISGKEFKRILATEKGSFKNVHWLAVASITVAILADRFKQRTREKIEFIFEKE